MMAKGSNLLKSFAMSTIVPRILTELLGAHLLPNGGPIPGHVIGGRRRGLEVDVGPHVSEDPSAGFEQYRPVLPPAPRGYLSLDPCKAAVRKHTWLGDGERLGTKLHGE